MNYYVKTRGGSKKMGHVVWVSSLMANNKIRSGGIVSNIDANVHLFVTFSCPKYSIEHHEILHIQSI